MAVLALVLPLLVALAVVLVRSPTPGPGTVVEQVDAAGPTRAPLDAAALVCPGAPDGAAATRTLTTSEADGGGAGSGDGRVTLGEAPVALAPGTVTATDGGPGPVVLSAEGDLAPGLAATRTTTRTTTGTTTGSAPLAATPCRPPASTQWFSAVGAAAEHASVLQLTNDQAGPAVAEVTVWSGSGPLDVPALAGVAVPAGETTDLDLSQVVPRRGDVGLRVEVTRGRLGVAVLDRQDPLTGEPAVTEWLPPQAAPARRTLLLGLARGTGSRTLGLVNPGDDEVGVELSVVTQRATFAPEGASTVRVAPGTATSVSLDDLLTEASRRGAVGLLVRSTAPVTATLRQLTAPRGGRADLSVLTPGPVLTAPTAVVVPPGRARLLLAGAGTVGTATVTALGSDGAELASREVEVAPDVAAAVGLPAGTALVRLDPGPLVGSLHAAVSVQGSGADPRGTAVLPVADLQRETRVPAVGPGLP